MTKIVVIKMSRSLGALRSWFRTHPLSAIFPENYSTIDLCVTITHSVPCEICCKYIYIFSMACCLLQNATLVNSVGTRRQSFEL